MSNLNEPPNGGKPLPAVLTGILADNCEMLIANGYEAIPVYFRDKRPIGVGWQIEPISTDRFAAALKEHGAVNVGCRCGKLVAVDIDVFETHPKFREIVAVWQRVLGEAPQRWGRKGCVLLYRTDTPMRKRVLKLGTYDVPEAKDEGDKRQKIEILGDGQQVVLFGIHPDTGKGYLWGDGLGPDPLEIGFMDLLPVTAEQIEAALRECAELIGVEYEPPGIEHAPQTTAPDVKLDQPWNIRRGEAYIKSRPAPREGERNDELFKMACWLRSFALSPDMVVELIETHWASLGLDDDEFLTTVASAFRNAQDAPGVNALRDFKDVFGKKEGDAPAAASAPKGERPSPFRVSFEAEMDNEPPIEWLVEDLLQTKSTAMIVGETGSYKSFIALDIALAVASGRETFGVVPSRTGPVVYAALEGLRGVKGDRRKAWREARGIEGELPFGTCKAPLVGDRGQCQEFINQVIAAHPHRNPELIILETVNKMMAGLNENEAPHAAILSNFCDELVEIFGCTVVVIHHKSDKVNAADVRGSSAFKANFDTMIEVSADHSSTTATVKVSKQKDGGAERDQPWRFKGSTVGPSMVLEPLSEAAHKEAVKGRDIFAPRNVGAALAKLGARGAPGVTTRVLAEELVEPLEGETTEQREAKVKAAERQLRRRAKLLAGYFEENTKGKNWYLPG